MRRESTDSNISNILRNKVGLSIFFSEKKSEENVRRWLEKTGEEGIRIENE